MLVHWLVCLFCGRRLSGSLTQCLHGQRSQSLLLPWSVAHRCDQLTVVAGMGAAHALLARERDDKHHVVCFIASALVAVPLVVQNGLDMTAGSQMVSPVCRCCDDPALQHRGPPGCRHLSERVLSSHSCFLKLRGTGSGTAWPTSRPVDRPINLPTA